MSGAPGEGGGGRAPCGPPIIGPIGPGHHQPPASWVDCPANLHVVAVFFNFYGRDNPLKNFRRFVAHMEALGVTLHIVELVRGALGFEVTDAGNPRHVQLRTQSEFFVKENLVNIGVANALRLYPEAEYLAWCDADIWFFNPGVVRQTMEQLNRFKVVQMWAMACDLGPDGVPMTCTADEASRVRKSFGYCHQHGFELTAVTKRWGWEWHTGYAWAMRRETWEAVGGLYDKAVVGSADNHMAWAFVGKTGWGLVNSTPRALKDDVAAWCAKAIAAVAGDVGYVEGLVHHFWHGRKTDRRYVDRLNIYADNDFDPALDLWRDARGLLHLTRRNPKLAFDIRAYMGARNDDTNTLA